MKKILCLILFLSVSAFSQELVPVLHWLDGGGDFTVEQNGKSSSYSGLGGAYFYTDGSGQDMFIIYYDGVQIRGGIVPEFVYSINGFDLQPLSGEALLLFRIHRNIVGVNNSLMMFFGLALFSVFINSARGMWK
jgi:hypothetical protein